MNELAAFHFLRPYWLLALPLLAWLLWRQHRRGRQASPWAEHCDAHLLPHILIAEAVKRSPWRLWPLALGGLAMILALAGPSWQQQNLPAHPGQHARVYLLDLSQSMNARDIAPSRLARSKQKLRALLEHGGSGRHALIVYAGSAHPLTPLTRDPGIITHLIPALRSELMPAPGSRAGAAIEQALALFKDNKIAHGDIILISDGAADPLAVHLAERARRIGHRLSVLAVATAGGAPIPAPQGGWLRDANGAQVISRLNGDELARLARAGGGLYQEIQAGPGDVAALLGQPPLATRAQAGPTFDQWRDQGPWLLLLALPLMLLAQRRGLLLALLALTLTLPMEPAYSDKTPAASERRAMTLFQAGDYARAAELFSHPGWRGSAYYRAGDYARAAEAFRQLDSADGFYNLGNALAMQGQWQAALDAYQQALRRDPRHEDARFNHELVQGWLADEANPATGASEQTAAAEPAPDGRQGASAPGKAKPAPARPPALAPWLAKLRDDPSELLRRKLLLQYRDQVQNRRGNNSNQAPMQPW